MKHGYQFEMGQTSFKVAEGAGSMTNDITDEIAGYQRQWAFSGMSTPSLGVGVVAGNMPNVFQSYADINDANIRGSNIVYANLYVAELNSKTIINQNYLNHFFPNDAQDYQFAIGANIAELIRVINITSPNLYISK